VVDLGRCHVKHSRAVVAGSGGGSDQYLWADFTGAFRASFSGGFLAASGALLIPPRSTRRDANGGAGRQRNVTASPSVGYLSVNLQREALRPPMRAFVAF